MENNKQVAVQQNKQVSFPTEGEWNQIVKIGGIAFQSGLLPTGIKSTQAATIIALKAWELGVPPMMAFQHMHVISGKPGYSAELMQYLVRKNLPGVQIIILESTDLKASVKIIRPERGAVPFTFSFSIEDAKRANLLSKDIWKQYPGSMLFSRCISQALRKICPDALMGASHTPDELGSNVAEEPGSFIETTSSPVAPPTPEPINVGPVIIPEIVKQTDNGFNAEDYENTKMKPFADPKENKFENLSLDEVATINKLTAQAGVSKIEVMSYCQKEFQKPMIAMTREDFYKLCDWLTVIGEPSDSSK